MSSFLVLGRLILSYNTRRWARALLGILGIAVSVCLVVWIIRGYSAVAGTGSRPGADAVGRFDVVVSPPIPRMFPGGGRGGAARRPPPPSDATPKYVDPELVKRLRKDPDVAEVVPAVRTRVRVVDPEPAVDMGPFGGGMLMGVADPVPPLPLAKGAWLEPGADAAAVISAGFGGRYGLDVGGALTVGGIGGEVQLKVVGIVGSDGSGGMPMFSPNLADIYVSFAAAEIVNGFTSRWNVINLVLRDGDRAEQFADDWAARTAAVTPPVSFSALRKKEGDPMAGRMLGMIELQAQNATVLAFLAAGFIIFATLSGGMRERLREMASLRAIAMSRKQLVAMIFLEGIFLALVGWSVGLVLSRGLLGLGNALAVYLRFFQAGAFADFPLSGSAILVSGACALIGSLAASALLAWQAARLKPIDILGGSPGFRSGRFPWFAVGIGALLVVANPIAVLMANVEPFKSFFAETYTMGFGPPLLGCGAMVLGMALVIPGVILLVEAVFGRLLALVLGLDRRFLRQQLTGNLWRTVWTTISLSAGLTLFVTALVWGYSMLVPFTPDKSLPRMLVSILPAGIPESAVAEVAKVDGVIPGECLAMAVEQPRLTGEMLASPAFASVDESQQHPLLMGVDPRKAFGGSSPVLGFTFIQGDREAAVRKLAEGRFCLVPDHFHTQTGLGTGDRFSLEMPDSPGKSVEYEIAGVVYVPGWNWFTKFADIRRRSGRALAMLFAGYEQVKADFGIDRISYFWMNVAPEVSVQEITMRLDPLADRHANVVVDVPGAGKAMVADQYIKITERGELIGRLNRRADEVIWSLTRFPLLALVIASLAVFNTVFGSMRARFWQFGILRGVGLSSWGLFRLVFSESLLIFATAGAMSLGAGTLLAWSGTRICTFFFYFAGRTPPLVLPWGGLSIGFGIAFGLCLLAGLIPAWKAAHKEPLRLIQAGRLSL